MSIKSVAEFTHLKANVLNDYYKNHLSGFHSWNQKKHSEEFTLYACNLGEHLAIDESSLSNGELYTIVTNKDGHGRKGTLVAMEKGSEIGLHNQEVTASSCRQTCNGQVCYHGHVKLYV